MNKKQIVRLTESDLHRIVKESVTKILKESAYDDVYVVANVIGDTVQKYSISKKDAIEGCQLAIDQLNNFEY